MVPAAAFSRRRVASHPYDETPRPNVRQDPPLAALAITGTMTPVMARAFLQHRRRHGHRHRHRACLV